jgi:hypothetical protein
MPGQWHIDAKSPAITVLFPLQDLPVDDRTEFMHTKTNMEAWGAWDPVLIRGGEVHRSPANKLNAPVYLLSISTSRHRNR